MKPPLGGRKRPPEHCIRFCKQENRDAAKKGTVTNFSFKTQKAQIYENGNTSSLVIILSARGKSALCDPLGGMEKLRIRNVCSERGPGRVLFVLRLSSTWTPLLD